MMMVAGPCYTPMSVLGTCSVSFRCLKLAVGKGISKVFRGDFEASFFCLVMLCESSHFFT